MHLRFLFPIICIIFISSEFIACATAVPTEASSINPEYIEAQPEIFLQERTEDSDSVSVQTEPDTTISAPEATEPEQVIQEEPAPLLNCTITAGKTPAEVRLGSSFKTDFSVTVTDSETDDPLAGIPVTVSYPAEKQNGKILFQSQEMQTDENGTVSFTAPTPSFSCDATVTFSIANAVEPNTTEIPFRVKTNRTNWGGTVSILDYTKSGNPVRDNSLSGSAVLTALIRGGFSGIGLADFIDEIDSGDVARVYKAAYNLIGTQSSFLIFGTVKYNGEIIKENGKYTVPFVMTLTCLDMRTGNILYETSFEASGTGSSEWDATNNARTAVAKEAAQRVLYGL